MATTDEERVRPGGWTQINL